MDVKKIFEIVERIEKSNLTKFEYCEKDTKILLEKNPSGEVKYENTVSSIKTEEPAQSLGKEVKSPIVGTYYSKPSPESDAFVSVGDKVKKGDVLCVIEAMKLFNEVLSETDGTVKEILLSDGDTVAYDQTIMIIE